MPHPEADEQKKDFMKRCIPDLIHEGREQKVAIAICYSIFGRENKVGDTSEEEYKRRTKGIKEVKEVKVKKMNKNDKTKLYLLHY